MTSNSKQCNGGKNPTRSCGQRDWAGVRGLPESVTFEPRPEWWWTNVSCQSQRVHQHSPKLTDLTYAHIMASTTRGLHWLQTYCVVVVSSMPKNKGKIDHGEPARSTRGSKGMAKLWLCSPKIINIEYFVRLKEHWSRQRDQQAAVH